VSLSRQVYHVELLNDLIRVQQDRRRDGRFSRTLHITNRWLFSTSFADLALLT
jgi:hypothetical protein